MFCVVTTLISFIAIYSASVQYERDVTIELARKFKSSSRLFLLCGFLNLAIITVDGGLAFVKYLSSSRMRFKNRGVSSHCSI